MSEFLIVRLSRDSQIPIRWLVWSSSQNGTIASGELSSRDLLGELAPYAVQRTTILLLDGRDLMLLQADIPAGAARQLETMLPFLLEDEIAQDIDEVHFSVLNKIAGKVDVAVIDKAYLNQTIQSFRDIGVEVRRAVPDTLCLPLLGDSISAVELDSHWLFRKGIFQAIVVESTWLTLFLQSDWMKASNANESQDITTYTAPPEIELEGIVWRAAEPELVMEVMAKEAVSCKVNLLSGKFKPQSSLFNGLKVWRKSAVALALFLAVFTLYQVIQIQQLETQASLYRAESERIFRSIFSEKSKIPTVSYLKNQMTNEERRLSGGGAEESVLNWLAKLPMALKDNSTVEIQNLRYDANRGEVRFDVTMDDFQTFEKVRLNLAKSFSVEQGPLDRKSTRVSGSFVLRKKP